MKKNKLWKIYLDNREPSELQTLFGLLCEKDYEVKSLLAGDFALYFDDKPAVGVERKRVDDLFQSIKDGRIFKQVDLMIDVYDVCYLAISRSIDDYIHNDNINLNMVMGTIASIVTRRDVNLIWFESDDHLITCVLKIFEKIMEGKYNDIEVARRKSDGFLSSDYYSLIKMPYIHHNSAMKLLKMFGDLEGVKNASVKELMKIKGIGKKRSKELKRVLNKC